MNDSGTLPLQRYLNRVRFASKSISFVTAAVLFTFFGVIGCDAKNSLGHFGFGDHRFAGSDATKRGERTFEAVFL
jgi:hypothetical protein